MDALDWCAYSRQTSGMCLYVLTATNARAAWWGAGGINQLKLYYVAFLGNGQCIMP